ncbi:MAG: hypothetical protein K2K10_08885 [Acetatifactor sp.]|nr:hypothetical protein [Acetatifactor sp.]
MWSRNNLLKVGFANVQNDERRVIDSNDLAARRIEELAQKMALEAQAGSMGGEDGSEDGFMAGLSAEQVEGLLSDDEGGSNVIKANTNADREQILSDAQQEAEELLAQAREQAEAQAEQILSDARAQAEAARESITVQARQQGYQEGMHQAEMELARKEQALKERLQAMEAEYEGFVEQLEPRFVDAITGVYEHLFQVELSSYRGILMNLIAATVRQVEGRDFLVHVSAEDYPYVSMEKKTLTEALASPNATLELVEDITLQHNECMIETEGGIYDCGLGTQLSELAQKLKLLSYEKH